MGRHGIAEPSATDRPAGVRSAGRRRALLLAGAALTLLAICRPSAVGPQGAQGEPGVSPGLSRIARADAVLQTALELIKIPSPSGREQNVAELILRKLRASGVAAKRDAYGNVAAAIAASPGHEDAPSLLLAAHMDMVVADSKDPLRAIRPRVVTVGETEWLASDGRTTLGADDKAGVATILDVAARIMERRRRPSAPVPHGPIELAFTKEEETTARGARELDTSQFQSKYVLVLDGEKLYQVVWELASATRVAIRLHGARGGHSGVDIDRPDNVNAVKVMSEIDALIPQGVIKRNERGVVASINAGLAEGGTAPNVIAPEAKIVYLLRSTDPAAEEALLDEIRGVVARIERKYQGLQPTFQIAVEIQRALPPWAAKTDSPLLKVVQRAAERVAGRTLTPVSIHAGAETNLYASKKNARGEALEPLLLGVTNLEAIHTPNERMDWRSLIAGRDWVLEIIRTLAEKTGSGARSSVHAGISEPPRSTDA